MLQFLQNCSALQAAGFFLASNLLIVLCSATGCWALGRLFASRRIFDRWEPLRGVELAAVAGSIVLNAVVSVVGWWLWRKGFIVLRETEGPRVLLDALVMLLVMDFGMYVAHRIAHIPALYQGMHRFHHRHVATNPISLFVLHPGEVAGFGGLMICFLLVYPMTVAGLVAFLTLNVVCGTVGHSGVEPFPAKLREIPFLRLLGTSTFHAEHHEHPGYNFGFYTLLWDKLFGTLDPEYDRRFART